MLAYLFTAVNTLSVASTPQTLSNAFTNSSLGNIPVLDLTIDPRFSLRGEYGETSLPLTPCLMNVVELLAHYAEFDWVKKVRRRHGVVLPGYPQVEIALLPAAPATTIEVRLIVWGLWVAIRNMISRNSFYEAEFEIYWEQQVVAFLYITKPMDVQQISSSSNGTLGSSDEPLTPLPSLNGTVSASPSSTEQSPNASNDDHFGWGPMFMPTAQKLTVYEVFLTVMAGIKNAAPHPAYAKVPGPYASAAIDIDANVQFYLHKRRQPRTRPPYFQFVHVIKALRLVPGYMLERGRFAELFFAVEVNGLQVAEGYLEKGHYTPPNFVVGDDVLGPIDNVSLS